MADLKGMHEKKWDMIRDQVRILYLLFLWCTLTVLINFSFHGLKISHLRAWDVTTRLRIEQPQKQGHVISAFT